MALSRITEKSPTVYFSKDHSRYSHYQMKVQVFYCINKSNKRQPAVIYKEVYNKEKLTLTLSCVKSSIRHTEQG